MLPDRLRPVLVKAASFCAYQERCKQEVVAKLTDWGLTDDEAESVLSELITQKYLNEKRFAASFARGKFRHSQWGKIKIRHELKAKGLSNDLIVNGLLEINEDEYEATLVEILQKKARSLKAESPQTRQQKLIRYALSKGFEMDLVLDVARKI